MKYRLTLLLVFSFCLTPVVSADFSRSTHYQPGQSRFEQRQQYLDAISYIRNGQRSRYGELKESLRTYPLYPYLEYNEYIYSLSRRKPEEISQFIELQADTPLAEQLRQNWLYHLARGGRWSTFLDFYNPESATDTNACSYAYALYRGEHLQEAFAEAERLWLVGDSQPDECDPVFRVWRDAGGLTPELAWQRFALALENSDYSLARYLERYLDDADTTVARLYQSVYRNPSLIRQVDRFRTQHPYTPQVVLHGLERYSRTEPARALDLFRNYEAIHSFDKQARDDTLVYIGQRLAGDLDPGNQLADIPVNLHEHPELVQSMIRLALQQSDWSRVLILINLLPADEQSESAWQYWKAHVLDQSINQADRDIAQSIFRSLAQTRTFYGFMAADRLGQSYNFVDEPSEVSFEQVLALEATPGIQRALELFTLNERWRARREWYFTVANYTSEELQIAARVAAKWGWHKAAIHSLIEAEAWNEIDLRFPVAYQETFISQARVADIPVNWGLAIARQESAFMPDARSSSGALGLMQLMPGTADYVARRIGESTPSEVELTRDTNLNIRLGTQYLGQMLRRFNNNRVLASAAYNAGPGNVSKWLDPTMPMEIWIESIPFNETRNYVKNVLMFSAIYARRLQQEQPLVYEHELLDFGQNQQVSSNP